MKIEQIFLKILYKNQLNFLLLYGILFYIYLSMGLADLNLRLTKGCGYHPLKNFTLPSPQAKKKVTKAI